MLKLIFCLFIVVTLIQSGYYLFVFGKLAFWKPKKINPKKIPISIIVCAKNEAENVSRLVPLLATQKYPDFEIVLIDDASTDNTLDIFEAFEKEYNNIRLVKVVNNEAFWGNKKFALTLGIKAARKEYLLFTDADCRPSSENWITEMSCHFTMQKTIVLGYGAYDKIANSLLNKIIRFETVLTAMQYLSWARLGRPYMGVGRNLAYKREEFFKVDGFRDHLQIRSGDDDLFINQVAQKKNTTISIEPASFTYSPPKTTFTEWFRQKRRHVSTASHYKMFDRLQLSVFYASQFLFILLFIILLAFRFEWMIVLGIGLFRYAVTWTVLGMTAAKLREKDTIYWYPFIEIVLVITQLNIFIANMFSKPVQWK